MEDCGKFPILQEVAKPFLACPATLAPSERIWACSGGVVTNTRTKLKNAVTSASMFVSENQEVLRKHYKEVTTTSRSANSAPSGGCEGEGGRWPGSVHFEILNLFFVSFNV
jgi:hypothetical protein